MKNVISFDSYKNAKSVVYILDGSMIKHVNGRNVSAYVYVEVRSHHSRKNEVSS